MPAMLTHRVLGDDVLKTIDPDCTIGNAVDERFELYSIGTSGPDIFFFYQAFPWGKINAKEVQSYGGKMHESDTKLMFKILCIRSKQSKDSGQIAYVTGILLHWALDHIAHPYVFNKTGWSEESDKPHKFFESQLDRGIINWKNIDITKFKTYSVVEYKEDDWYPMWQLYSEVLRTIWQIDLEPSEMKQAVKDFYFIEKLLYNPDGKTYKRLERMEKMIKAEGLATSMITPVKLDENWDVMNEKKNIWHHPSTNDEYTYTFYDLFDQAKESGKELLEKYNNYLEDKGTLDELLELITGNFHTGLDVKDDMKYFDYVPTVKPEI